MAATSNSIAIPIIFNNKHGDNADEHLSMAPTMLHDDDGSGGAGSDGEGNERCAWACARSVHN